MAISVSTPKNLNRIKPKLVAGLTKRQVICFTLGAACAVPVYFLLRKPAGTTTAMVIMMIILMPFFFLAMYEKNGKPAEKYLGMIIKYKMSKHIRPYRAVNLFKQLEEREKKRKEVLLLEEKAGRGRHFNKNKEAEGPGPHAKSRC